MRQTPNDPSMFWNYRLVKVEDRVALHEVYYNVHGDAESCTENPSILDTFPDDPHWDKGKSALESIEGLINRIQMDLLKNPNVLEWPKDFKECDPEPESRILMS
tara:strand:- start:397 stop:708 length:312 start_codon:yes stop_codon:yes gene_type:complete